MKLLGIGVMILGSGILTMLLVPPSENVWSQVLALALWFITGAAVRDVLLIVPKPEST